jgi:Arc/MetJ-type ribon-helix-helix transcriptional regulator
MIGKAIREPASALLAPADVLRDRRICNALRNMKTLTVRLPEPLLADIEAESRGRKISKSDVVRERLQLAPRKRRRNTSLNTIADLIASRNQLEKRLA